jgi:hypothetical protein
MNPYTDLIIGLKFITMMLYDAKLLTFTTTWCKFHINIAKIQAIRKEAMEFLASALPKLRASPQPGG